jgi:putative alpha-1,2-mannosidase
MSSWFVMRSIGLSPANIGSPIYYLTAPIFENGKLNWENGKSFHIKVSNFKKDHFYIQSVRLNCQPLFRNWSTQEEITNEGSLIIETGALPSKNWEIKNQWISKTE